MKRLLLGALGALALVLLTGCPIILLSAMTPDLVITLGRFDPTANNTLYAGVGGSLFIPVTITDQTGRAVTGTFEVTFTLQDAVPADIATTTLTVTAGSEQIVEWAALDAAVIAGSYTLVATLVVPDGTDDAATNNNTALGTVSIGATTDPDLAVTVTVPGGSICPEGTFTAVFEIMNLGFGEVASGTDITLDFTVNLSAVDTSLGTATVTLAGTLYPGAGSVIGTASLTMATLADLAPDNGETTTTFTSWTENMTVTVDSPGDITESNELNNTGTVSVTSRSALPDLQVQSVSFSSPAVIPGQHVAVVVVVENIGAAAALAGTYSVVVYLDENDSFALDTGETLHEFALADTPVVPWDDNAVANTALFVVPADVVFPDTFTYDGSSHRIRAEIVPDTALTEWDATNNDGNTGLIPLYPGSYDVEPGLLTLDSHVIADGEDILGTLEIRNNGDDDLDDSMTVELWASADSNLQSGDVLLGSMVVAVQIPANGAEDYAVDLTSIEFDVSDLGYVYAVLDTLGDIGEIDENNNAHPDFGTNEATAASSALIWDDEDGARTFDIRVILFRPTAAVQTGDTVFDGGEIYDNTGALVTNLSFSAFNNYSTNNLAPGTYYLRVAGTGTLADSGPYGIVLTGQSASYAYFPSALSTNVADILEPDDTATANVPDAPVSLSAGVQRNRYLGHLEVDWFTFTLP